MNEILIILCIVAVIGFGGSLLLDNVISPSLSNCWSKKLLQKIGK